MSGRRARATIFGTPLQEVSKGAQSFEEVPLPSYFRSQQAIAVHFNILTRCNSQEQARYYVALVTAWSQTATGCTRCVVRAGTGQETHW